MVSEPTYCALCYSGADCLSSVSTTYQALCYIGAGCLSGVRTYLPGTVLQWCRLFKRCQNLPARHCVTVVQTVLAVSEPTCSTLCYSGAGRLSSVGTYLPGTVLQWCYCFSNVRTYLPGTMLQWCRLFKQCQILPTGHCVTMVQTVKEVSEPTYRALCYSGADCFSNVGTYLPGTVLQWCRLF